LNSTVVAQPKSRSNLFPDDNQSEIASSCEHRLHKRLADRFKQTNIFDTRHWRSICDVTLTLKQARQSDDLSWVRIDETECRRAFRHFTKLLDRTVYGNAVRRYGKRLRVISVLEKSADGRWHIHAAIEPPRHIKPFDFRVLIHECWRKVDWAHKEMKVGVYRDAGWIDYMLKPKQKSGLEVWSDCIDWTCFYNPIADA
jgi:hypothetical protein